jgi:mannitol-specific phosphotransferase system IIBC component
MADKAQKIQDQIKKYKEMLKQEKQKQKKQTEAQARKQALSLYKDLSAACKDGLDSSKVKEVLKKYFSKA